MPLLYYKIKLIKYPTVVYRDQNEATKKPQPSPEEIVERISIATKLVPDTFNSSIMCIGSELGGIGACRGDEGGPGFIFDTGDQLNSEKYVQVRIQSLCKTIFWIIL